MTTENRKTSKLLSTLMILVGSVILGLMLGKVIVQYQREHNVLDEIVEISDELIESDEQIFLDLSSTEVPPQEESHVIAEANNFVQAQISDEELLEQFYARVPKHILIPEIGLDSEIGFSGIRDVEVDGKMYKQWISPNDEVGWHYDSAVLGEKGNTVLNGHHNIFAEVFRDLHKLQKGDEIVIESGNARFYYVVASTMILPERFESNEVRLQNAKWIQQSEDERVTLITCWPYDSNTHRVIVVAFPTGEVTPINQEQEAVTAE